jgi:hypothetical protein
MKRPRFSPTRSRASTTRDDRSLKPLPDVIAIVVTDLKRSRLGLPSRVDARVLWRTVARVARVKGIDAIALLHPPGQTMPSLDVDVPVHAIGALEPPAEVNIAARKWALECWRGGLGGATCYDELLPATSWLAAMNELKAQSTLIAGADWMLIDPDLCEKVLALHRSDPGLCGIAAGRTLVEQFAEKHVGFGRLLAYAPQRPQADPIGRDVCVQIDARIRSCARRFIYDTDRSAAMMDRLPDADALAVCRTVKVDDALPREYAVELTPRRIADGPIVPQHHVTIGRNAMTLENAMRIVGEIAQVDDAVVMFGGLGDALLHDDWRAIVTAAHDAGVFGIGIETDLLVGGDVLDSLLSLPIDVVAVRINADTAATYDKLMRAGSFKQVVDNMQSLLQRRAGRDERNMLPWIVPRLIKTAATLADMETFFERWMTYTAQAMIDPATTGCGLMPDFAPLDMAGPKRRGCRQIERRVTIHADATVAQCDQDWLARGCTSAINGKTLADAWDDLAPLRAAHRNEQWQRNELCSQCREWHRP